MFTLFSLIIFFGILLIFGWQLARYLLQEKRIEALIPIAAIMGAALYIFSLNLLSYLIDIRINFYLLLAVFAFLSYFLYRVNRKREKPEWGITASWRKILFGTCLMIMIPAGIIGLRDLTTDQMAVNHLLLTSTIAEGNFPVREIFAPDLLSRHHYGYNLFWAAIAKITHLPIWFVWHIHGAFFAGIAFLLGFLLIEHFSKSNFRAWLASLVMILGGNLYFIYGIEGLSSENFRFLNDMIFGKVMRGALAAQYIASDWVILGFALTIAVVYFYFKAVNNEGNWFKISIIGGVIFALLALSAEVFFGPLAIVILAYPLICFIFARDRQKFKHCFKVSFLILFLGSSLALVQGGIITQTAKQILFGYAVPAGLGSFSRSLSITPEYLFSGRIFVDENVFIPVFSSTFFLAWGWLILFIVPVAIYVLKKYFQLGLFLLLLIFISFFIPLIVTAGSNQGNFARVNLLTAFFWNLIFGLFLAWLLSAFRKRWQRMLTIILIFGVVLQGLSYLILFSIFFGRGGQPVLKPDLTELPALNWIKKQTAIEDYFLTFGEDPLDILPNSRFILYTGRIAPAFFQGPQLKLLPFQNEKKWYLQILEECKPEALENLGYRYLYVNANWPEGLAEKCLASNDLELVFQSGDNKIYKNK